MFLYCTPVGHITLSDELYVTHKPSLAQPSSIDSGDTVANTCPYRCKRSLRSLADMSIQASCI